MHISDFDYYLPPERIARTPAEPRDASRMMVLDSRSGSIVDSSFRNLPDFLRPSDVLVLNDTRVIRARTRARLERRNGSTREMEVFFAEPLGEHVWQVLCKPGRRIRPGDRAIFGRGEFVGIFQESTGDLHVLELESAENLAEELWPDADCLPTSDVSRRRPTMSVIRPYLGCGRGLSPRRPQDSTSRQTF